MTTLEHDSDIYTATIDIDKRHRLSWTDLSEVILAELPGAWSDEVVVTLGDGYRAIYCSGNGDELPMVFIETSDSFFVKAIQIFGINQIHYLHEHDYCEPFEGPDANQ